MTESQCKKPGQRVVAIVQARMSSTRLPGKVLVKVQGKTLLAHHIERARQASSLDAVVVATTTNPADDAIVALCGDLGFAVVRGSEGDVLSRYALAARQHRADFVVRLCADCPLIDPDIVDAIVRAFLDHGPGLAYASNRLVHTYPRGLDAEVCTAAALYEADCEATDAADREHVTPFIWRQPQRYRLLNVPCHQTDVQDHRWTVDTAEDLELVRRIIDALYPTKPQFRMQDCLAVVDAHPDWAALNSHVQQRLLG